MSTMTVGMHFSVHEEPDVEGTRVRLVGALDLAAVPLLLVELRRVGATSVTLDLSELGFLSLTGMHALTAFARDPRRTVSVVGAKGSVGRQIALMPMLRASRRAALV